MLRVSQIREAFQRCTEGQSGYAGRLEFVRRFNLSLGLGTDMTSGQPEPDFAPDGRARFLEGARLNPMEYSLARIGEAMPTMQEIMSLSGKRAAHASHAKDREKAETIEAWWRESRHHYKSMDAAAEAATEIVNVGFRTARKHIGEEAKIIKGKKHDG